MTSSTAPWPMKTLADLGARVTSGSRGWASFYSDHGDLFVRITNLTRDRIRPDLTNSRFVKVDPNNAEALRTRLAPGDLLVSITADIGIIGYVDETVPAPAYINQHIARVRLDPRKADSRFVAYYLSSWVPQRAFIGATDQGAKAGMNLTTVANLLTGAPAVAEQARIAEALSAADDLIRFLERLLVKKKEIKQGMAQQLLTGRTRLPGYQQPWVDRRIAEVASITKGTQLGRASMDSGKSTPVWNGGVQPSGFTSSPNVERPVVTVSEGGNSCGWVGRPQGAFWLGGHCYALEPKPAGHSVSFLYHRLKLAEPHIMALRVGSGLPNIQKKRLSDFVVTMPTDSDEAAAIARVQEAADGEIVALHRRLKKARAIKTGMMQQLLTGCVRLPVEAAS
jgi:type I restriction enzyme, S subunit